MYICIFTSHHANNEEPSYSIGQENNWNYSKDAENDSNRKTTRTVGITY